MCVYVDKSIEKHRKHEFGAAQPDGSVAHFHFGCPFLDAVMAAKSAWTPDGSAIRIAWIIGLLLQQWKTSKYSVWAYLMKHAHA